MADLCDRRRLSGPVHAGEEDLHRPLVLSDIVTKVEAVAKHPAERGAQGRDDQVVDRCADLPVPAHEVLAHPGDDLVRDRERDVVLEEDHLEFKKRRLDVLLLDEDLPLPDKDPDFIEERGGLPLLFRRFRPGGRRFRGGGGGEGGCGLCSLRRRRLYLGGLLDVRGELCPYILKLLL